MCAVSGSPVCRAAPRLARRGGMLASCGEPIGRSPAAAVGRRQHVPPERCPRRSSRSAPRVSLRPTTRRSRPRRASQATPSGRALGADEPAQARRRLRRGASAAARSSSAPASSLEADVAGGSRRSASRRTAAPVARCRSRSRSAAPPADAGVGLGVAEGGAAVLDVVVERPVDVGDVAAASAPPGRASGRGTARRATRGNGSARSTTSRRISDAAPVIVLAISSESRLVWLLRALGPVGLGQHLAVGVDEPLVAVDELRRRPSAVTQRRQLVRVPAVVLVAEGDQRGVGRAPCRAPARSCGRSRAGASRARDDEALVAGELGRDLAEAVGPRAVVADDADPVARRSARGASRPGRGTGPMSGS